MGDLKENIVKTLESKGILDSLKAQLRSQVLLALDAQIGKGSQVLKPESLKILESEEGRLCVEIVREFLEYAKFKNTLEVFVPEGHLSSGKADRMMLENKTNVRFEQGKPLLMTILDKVKNSDSFNYHNPAKPASSFIEKSQPAVQEIARAPIPKFQALLEENSKKAFTFSGKPKEEEPPKSTSKVITAPEKQAEIKPADIKPVEAKPEFKAAEKLQDPKQAEDKFKLAPLGPRVGFKLPSFKGFDDLAEDIPPKNSPPKKAAEFFDSEESIEESIDETSEEPSEFDHKELLESVGTNSMGIDVSVNSLALEEFDHVERVKPAR